MTSDSIKGVLIIHDPKAPGGMDADPVWRPENYHRNVNLLWGFGPVEIREKWNGWDECLRSGVLCVLLSYPPPPLNQAN